MPITVNGPGGVNINFPDGTDAATINGVMAQHFGGGQDKAVKPDKSGATSAFAGGVISGVPILGPLVQKGSEKAAAGIRSVMSGKPYADELKAVEGYAEKTQKEHPIAEASGEVVGGVASLGGLGATATGARLLGLTADTLPGLIVRGAASGTAINAADSVARGGGIGDDLESAGIGGLAGAVSPIAGRAISAAAAPVARTLRGIYDPAAEASRRVAGALERDIGSGNAGLTAQEFSGAKQAGTPVNLMDAGGETTRALARSAANTSPEGRATLNNAVNARYETQSNRLTDWMRSSFHYPDATAQQDALEKVAKTVNRPAYLKAYREGSGGLWSPELERLAGSDAVNNAMQGAVKSAKDEAIISGYGAMNPRITFTDDGRIQFTKGKGGVPTYPDLQFWDLTRRELSDAAKRAAPGTTEQRRLGSFAKTLNAELDKLVPSYADARAGAAKFFGAEDALDAGQKAVTSRMKNGEIRAGLGKMSPLEKQLFRDGFVDKYVQSIRELPDRRSVLNQISTSPAARERLMMIMGPQKANELEAMLRVEGVMDLARGAVQGNSTTARQLVELGLAGGAYGVESGGNILNPDPSAIMHAALVYGAVRGHRVIDTRVAEHVAKLLVSSDPKQLAKGLKLIARNKTMLGSIRQADAGLAAIAGRGAAPAVGRELGVQ